MRWGGCRRAKGKDLRLVSPLSLIPPGVSLALFELSVLPECARAPRPTIMQYRMHRGLQPY